MAPINTRTITLVSTAAENRPPATQQELENFWASKVTGSAGDKVRSRSSPIVISMAGLSLEDSKMDNWCKWFEKFVKENIGDRREPFNVKEVNFSSNRLSAPGIQKLLSTLLRVNARVSVLKLFQNELQKPDDVLDFITSCDGCMRELHLSHNKLDTVGVRDIIVTTAAATSASGSYSYPRASGSVPLWLRLEGNRIDAGELYQMLKSALQQIGRPYEKSICEVDGKSKCCPSCCDRFQVPPPVHVTYLKLAEHSKQSNRIPASLSKVPTLPKAALRAAAPKASAKATAKAAAASPTAALQQSPSVRPPPGLTAGSPESSPKASPDSAMQSGTTANAEPVCSPTGKSPAVTEDKSFSLQDDFPALGGAPSGASSGAAKAKVAQAAATWGAKSPIAKASAPAAQSLQAQRPAVAKAKSVPASGDQDFPALPSTGKKKKRAAKAAAKQSAMRGIIQQPDVASLSTSASTGFDELDGHPESAAGGSEIQGTESWHQLQGEDETNNNDAGDAHEHVAEACEQNGNGWSTWIAYQDYEAEAPGYLSIRQGEQLQAYQTESPSVGDSNCAWTAYVYARSCSDSGAGAQGWLPLNILAIRYHDENVRLNWLYVPSTDQSCYEEE